MRPKPPWIAKVALAAASGAAALALAWAFRPRSYAPATVEITDIGDQVEAVLTERAGRSAEGDPTTFALADLPEDVIRSLLPPMEEKGRVFDPLAGFRRAPNLVQTVVFPEHPAGTFLLRTNDRGFREDEPARAPAPGLRILLTGDSHAEGVCTREETFAERLEADLVGRGLDADVLNAAAGGYSFFNYLGILQGNLDLDPDVFVLVAYGGNDFSALMACERYFHGRPAPVRTGPELRAFRGEAGLPGVVPQELSQALYFARNAEDVERSVAMANAVTDHVARLCEENDVRLLCAYLPAASQVQPSLYTEFYAAALQLVDLSLDDLGVADRLADGWLAHLRERGIESVDLRPTLSAADEPVYWFSDFHLNVAGHELVARELARGLDL